MQKRGSHVVGYFAGHRAEALRRQARNDHIMIYRVTRYTFHVQSDGYFLVLLPQQLDATHLIDLAQLVGHHIGIIL